MTHSCFDPRALATYYPRGSKELIGVFFRFQPLDTIRWFKARGVELKTEEDGRMFPITDSSETVIACLMKAVKEAGVDLKTGLSIEHLYKKGDFFYLETKEGEYRSKKIVLASGSAPQGHLWAKQLGHSIVSPVPSLFTFNVPASPLLLLSGISVPKATVSIIDTRLKETGPVLLTHFGFSGPAILRLSAWGAPILYEKNYQATLKIDWTAGMPRADLKAKLEEMRKKEPGALISLDRLIELPKNLAKALYPSAKRYSELSHKEMENLISIATASTYNIEGKTTYKSEFVTAGGVAREEIDFKTMESRVCKGLYFAGEILDIDGVTGGFNFQNAWSTGYIAATGINNSI